MTLNPRHFAALSGLCVLLTGAASAAGSIGDRTGDMWHYYTVSGLMLRGEWPYRDFPWEYPPLALLPLMLPRLLILPFSGGYAAYVWAFLLQNVLLTSALARTALQMSAHFRGARTAQHTFLLLTGFLIACPNLSWRYDLFPALLTALAFSALLRGQTLGAGIWLGWGTAAKLYPVVLLPLFFLYYFTGNNRPAGRRLTLGFILALGICFLPVAALPPPALLSFIKYHQMRGLEIESVPAGIILLGHLCGLTSASVIANYGAEHLVSPAAPPVIRSLPWLFTLLYGGVLWKAGQTFRREQEAAGRIKAETLLVFMVAGLLAFLLANKVFSPQYLIWLLPFVPLLRPGRALAFLAVFVLTTAVYPFAFPQLCLLSQGAILLVTLRNALLLACFANLLFCSQEREQSSVVSSLRKETPHAAC